MGIASIGYACYARWTYGGIDYYASTDAGYRAGFWHDPVLRDDLPLKSLFSSGVVAGASISIAITDGPTGAYRSLVASNVIDGTAVVVETVCTTIDESGFATEQAVTQTLTVQGSRIEPGIVTLTLIDLEDAKLDTLYPPMTWSADVFRDIDGGSVGRAIPYPVGTCRKLPTALLSSDTTNAYWYYGVCDAPLLTLPIIAISTGSKTFTVAGDYSDRISAGTVLFSSTSSANAGRYTVSSAVYGGVNTVITVVEAIGSATVSGNLLVPPTVLAVYRDGRLVASTEYTVEMTWPVLTQQLDSDFDNSPVDWIGLTAGTGTAALTGGVGRLTGDGTATNYGRLTPTSTATETQRDALTVATLTLVTAGKVRLTTGSTIQTGSAVMSGQGTHTALVRHHLSSGQRRIDVSDFNTGYSGTVDVDDLSLNTTHRLLVLRFVREQIGFDGQPYAIECDVRGVDSRNAVSEISRLLTAVGATPDAASFASAVAYADTKTMLVDVDHGAAGEQRRVRALLDDLLWIARASLSVSATGEYAITQDRAASSTATLDEEAGDAIEVLSLDKPAKPLSVGVRFSPRERDPSDLAYIITRTVTGGMLAAEQPRDVRYLANPTAADQLAGYRALREQFNMRLRFRQFNTTRALGEVVTISAAATYPSARDWFVSSVSQVPGGVECEALEYDPALHVYTASALPVGATTVYQPDYSQTPPAAPTALRITTAPVRVASTGETGVQISADCNAPAVNATGVVFVVIHNTTGEIWRAFGVLNVGLGPTRYEAAIPGVRPGEVYKLNAWATNAFGVDGTPATVFDATAIGGGAADTTFTAPGTAAAPATVSSLSAVQQMGRIVDLSWPRVAGENISAYVIDRKLGAGSYAEIARPNGTAYTDTNVVIGSQYTYRIKALSTSGVLSAAYATSSAVTLTSTVYGGSGTGDIANNTVGTPNRTGVSTASATITNRGTLTVTHGLGKQPVATSYVGGKGAAVNWIRTLNTTTIVAAAKLFGNLEGDEASASAATTSSNNSVAGDPHTHTVTDTIAVASFGLYIDYW